MTRIEQFTTDIARLANFGGMLVLSMQKQYDPSNVAKNDLSKEQLSKIPDFNLEYEGWYSECLALIKQIIPDRELDFKSYYVSKQPRREIGFANYTISDALRGLTGTRLDGKILYSPKTAISLVYQQHRIVAGLVNRFSSTLYDIKALVHADLLDDELEAAGVLVKSGFPRGAGAVAGVVLEGHLAAVCARHSIALRKKDPAISDLNDALKNAETIEISQWRFIQHLGDIRNKCDHKKSADPTAAEVTELIDGVRKITKTVL